MFRNVKTELKYSKHKSHTLPSRPQENKYDELSLDYFFTKILPKLFNRKVKISCYHGFNDSLRLSSNC